MKIEFSRTLSLGRSLILEKWRQIDCRHLNRGLAKKGLEVTKVCLLLGATWQVYNPPLSAFFNEVIGKKRINQARWRWTITEVWCLQINRRNRKQRTVFVFEKTKQPSNSLETRFFKLDVDPRAGRRCELKLINFYEEKIPSADCRWSLVGVFEMP